MKPKVSTTTLSTSTKTKTTSAPTTKQTTVAQTTSKLSTTTRKAPTATTRKVLIETTISPSTVRPRTTSKLIATTTEGHHRLGSYYDGIVLSPDTKFIEAEDNEAEAIPNIEIIPFVAHDAIDTDKFLPYLKPFENLEKDFFASDKEKPYRYNNKFIQHGYDESEPDYVYTNPHERIDNGPYYYEANDNQFDSFSPPSEQDFLGE